jgi:hypothetical protein
MLLSNACYYSVAMDVVAVVSVVVVAIVVHLHHGRRGDAIS